MLLLGGLPSLSTDLCFGVQPASPLEMSLQCLRFELQDFDLVVILDHNSQKTSPISTAFWAISAIWVCKRNVIFPDTVHKFHVQHAAFYS